MRQWMIPTVYTVASVAAAMAVPRLEQHFMPDAIASISVGSALAFYSAVAGGMMALTGIVFAVAFVLVQFSAVAYSPRLVGVIGGGPGLFHTMGLFFATFTYAIAAMLWTDRSGSGKVPMLSSLLVSLLLVASMLAFAMLVQSLADLRINNVLQTIGSRGRAVIRGMFPKVGAEDARIAPLPALPPAVQTLAYDGEPCVVTHFDTTALVRLAESADAVIVMECAVGDTLVETAELLHVHGTRPVPEAALLATIHTGVLRTLDQDPKYAFRLLVDIAIRALSPAVNDPTTAVQALDQIEDLLRRLARRELEAGRAHDAAGRLRLVFPTPSWEDYLSLAFDEIRQFGATSIQVTRRMRASLVGLAEVAQGADRRDPVLRYLDHLTADIARSGFDEIDRAVALGEDPQGLGLPRNRPAPPPLG